MIHWQIPFSYEEYELSFINGLIPIMVNGAKVVIDSDGNYILSMDKEYYVPRRIGSSFFACNNVCFLMDREMYTVLICKGMFKQRYFSVAEHFTFCMEHCT